ncbi:MAG: endonuclease [Acidiferrobacteraceae bacterium]|nr:endonuclease [Acidiferrobacteraceae bacterium]
MAPVLRPRQSRDFEKNQASRASVLHQAQGAESSCEQNAEGWIAFDLSQPIYNDIYGFCCGCRRSPVGDVMNVRVVSYNIHKCIGGVDRRYDPSRIVDVIGHYQPDLVLLQEVVRYSRESPGMLQADVLGEALEFSHRVWIPNVRVQQSRGYGNAILSRWPIIDSDNINLTIGPKKRRSALYGKVRVPLPKNSSARTHSRTLHLFNLHLGLSGIERRLQLKKLLVHEHLDRVARATPVVVAGDLNDVWGTLGRQLMRPAGFRGTGRNPRTFPAYAPVRPLDSLYVRGEIEIDSLMSSRLAAARQASDHLPLVADLTVSE